MLAIALIMSVLMSFAVASMGKDKKIGYTNSLLLSLFLSPIIGILFVIASPEKKKDELKGNLPTPHVKKLTDLAIEKMDLDLDKAIEIMNEALLVDPKVGQTHYNLACLYSRKLDKSKAFKHLSKAAELKYLKVRNAKTANDFEWLRQQTEFRPFILNGYKIEEEQPSDQDNSKDYIDELKELAKLKDQGILTPEEFEEKKSFILVCSLVNFFLTSMDFSFLEM